MSVTKISIVIPTYNRPTLLNRAIRSVLKQKIASLSLELMVVDDGSSIPVDLSEFINEPIRYIRLNQNVGPQIARNTGIHEASGKWVLMLDDDDELLPGALSQVMQHIRKVENYSCYPVFFFATTIGYLPEPYRLIGPADLMNHTLKGDFTPVLQKALFEQHQLRYLDYPEIHGVGCEQLTWLQISSQFGIPSFMNILVQVNHDAPMRLTSYDNFIRNSYKFALQQDITIDFVKEHHLQELSPGFVEKKTLGAAIYYLVSGHQSICRTRIRSLGKGATNISRLLLLLSYFPVFISRFLFLKYKQTFSK